MKTIRTWIAGGLLAAATLPALAGPATAQETVTLRWADQLPLTHSASKLSVQTFMRLLGDDPRVKIQHYPAEQLAKASGMLDALRSGVADVAFIVTAYSADKLPLTTGVELPGLYADTIAASRAFEEMAQNELLEEEYLKRGVRPLFVAITPHYQVYTSRELTGASLAEFEGLKVRAAGSTAELIAQSVGMVPARVSPSDIYLGIERGTIDGAIFNGPSVMAYKLDEVIASATTNARLGTVSVGVFINEDVWQDLSPEVQELLADLGRQTGEIYAKGGVADQEASNRTLADKGVKMVELPQDVLDEMDARMASVRDRWIEQMEGRGLPARETLDAFAARLEAQQ